MQSCTHACMQWAHAVCPAVAWLLPCWPAGAASVCSCRCEGGRFNPLAALEPFASLGTLVAALRMLLSAIASPPPPRLRGDHRVHTLARSIPEGIRRARAQTLV